MSLSDWCIVLIPLAFVVYMGFWSRRYIVQVSDFLTAGRCARRYLISFAGVADGLSIVALVSYLEVVYKTGFALSFWNNIMLPLSIVMGLTGFCTYRFRQTRAMSFGQLLEIRYSRKLRIFSAILRSLSEILANMIMPAIAARFFINFLDLPRTFTVCGMNFSTFNTIMIITVSLAVLIVCLGGTLSLMITDCIQGMISYPLMTLFVVFVLFKFSWGGEVIPVMNDRTAGESFLNPYDVSSLRDFNLFYIGVGFFSAVLHRGSWIGYGSDSAAISPHEQKMAGLLGNFRGVLAMLFYLLVSVAVITFMNHESFASGAKKVRDRTSRIAACEVIPEPAVREKVVSTLKNIPEQKHQIGKDAPLSDVKNLETTYFDTVQHTLNTEMNDPARSNYIFQKFRTVYNQMLFASGMREMLPAGMIGLFCLLMVLAMLSTDDSRIFGSALTVAQDVVMPLIKRSLSGKEHLRLLRWAAVFVGICFFIGSSFMAQLDYIRLFVTTMCIIWMGGCGPVMIFGLYSRFGTTAGAWTSLLTGLFMALFYVAVTQCWTHIYQLLIKWGILDEVTSFIEVCSRPFEPYIVWRMSPVKFPINANEYYFLTMLITLILYITVSFLNKREPFNLDRMLYRGKYNLDNKQVEKVRWNWKSVWGNLIGITPEFSRGDKVIAWSIFGYSIVFQFIISFVGVIIWNAFFWKWSMVEWGWYFLITTLVVPGIIAAIVAVWFGLGIIVDFRHFFRDIKNRKINELDNGRVEGNMSLADKKELEKVDAEKTAGHHC